MEKSAKKTLKIILASVFIIAVIIAVFLGVNAVMKDINGTQGGAAEEYTLNIKSAYQYDVAAELKKGGMIIDDSIWSLWMDNHYPDFEYINGEYYMNTHMSYEEIAQKLKTPDISHKPVTVAIPEGFNVFDIAKTLEENGVCKKADFYKAVSTTNGYSYSWLADLPKDNKNIGFILEGFLFPATYDLAENTPAAEVVDDMLDAFDSRLNSDILAYCDNNNMSLYEFITLCSIVQEESFSIESAENIASVLVNRLKNGSKLQCDVTYFYAKNLLDYGFSREVYDSYYTYRCPALPSGPITNSGMEVVNAVIRHPNTKYLFFFSDLNGDFHFAETGEEFEQLKKQYPWQ